MAGLRTSRQRAIPPLDTVEQPAHGAVRRRQARGDVEKVKVGPVVDDRRAGRDPDGAAEVAHHVEQAAGVFQPRGRQAAKAESDGWRYREDLGESAQELW